MKKFTSIIFALLITTISFAEKIIFPISGFETIGEKSVPIQIEWNEKWFGEKVSYEYNHNLARIAAVLSEVAYINTDNPELSDLNTVYTKLGVKNEDIEYHYDIDYDAAFWGHNQAAFSFAVKKINSAEGIRDLVFITIRGTPAVASEWISNIDISDSTRKAEEIHEGFFYTTEQIHKSLIYFLLRKHINPDNAFFLITGHSRGAAVANLLGATLADEEYFDITHIFDYTFAAPNVSMELRVQDPKYYFIWNIINAEDIVPTVPPNRDNWQYKKFGQTIALPNAWNTDKETYEENYLKRINAVFNQLCGRNYSPFRTGPFISSQITRLLTSFYGEVAEYYGTIKGLRIRGENLFLKLFPDKQIDYKENTDSQKEKGNSRLMSKIVNDLNESFPGVFDYATEAFVDMHAAETYLSFMITLEEDEISKTLGSSQIVIENAYEAAVFNSNGEVIAKVVDGLLQLKSLHLPIAAMPFLRKTVIGFPANEDFTVIIYKDSLIPTLVPITVEHFNAAGIFIGKSEKNYTFPHKAFGYKFTTGKMTYESDSIKESAIYGKELKNIKKTAELTPKLTFRIQPEINFDTDFNLEFGVHLGCPMIYGSLLTGQSITKLGKAFMLTPGIGHQECLYDRLYLDIEAYGKCFLATGSIDEDESRFNLVPSARFSLSYKPFHRFQIFAASVFDFNIEDFNDGAFNSDIRKKNLGKIGLSESVNIVPSIKFGLKF